MKFNLGDLERLFEQIKDIIYYVEKANLKNRRNTLFLSNGDNIKYCVPDFTIAHLLGIDTTYLDSTCLFKSHNSFELLKQMSEDPYKIYTNSCNKIISQDQLFSSHIKEKISIFKENIKINVFQTEFVCKYDKNKAFYNSEINENCDYIIVKKYENSKIGIILLKQNNFLFIPMSNRVFENIDDASEYLKKLLLGQEITILSGSAPYNIERDYEKKIILDPHNKRKKFESLEKYKEIFNCSIDMSSDYKYLSNKLLEKSEEKFENNTSINEIVTAMAKGSLIDRTYYLDPKILEIIDVWNNYICNTQTCNNTVSSTYTETIIKLEEAKKLIEKLKTENKSLNNAVTILTQEKEQLTIINNDQEKIINKVFELTKPNKN